MRNGKYNARKITTEDGTFDSQIEYMRWLQLSNDPEIDCLERQPRYELTPKQKHGGKSYRATHYTPDFRYKKGTLTIVEEVKSEGTRKVEAYALRRAMFIARYGDEVQFVETVM